MIAHMVSEILYTSMNKSQDPFSPPPAGGLWRAVRTTAHRLPPSRVRPYHRHSAEAGPPSPVPFLFHSRAGRDWSPVLPNNHPPHSAFPTREHRVNWDGQGADSGLYSSQSRNSRLAWPRVGANPPLKRILVGMYDYGTGLDRDSFQVTANFPVGSLTAGETLASHFAIKSDGVWEWNLAEPLSDLPEARLTVSVRDRQGNTTRIERAFSVGKWSRDLCQLRPLTCPRPASSPRNGFAVPRARLPPGAWQRSRYGRTDR